MSRILRRPMFRGGRVDSRGTGITSGLDDSGYADGGRVGFQRGGGYSTIPGIDDLSQIGIYNPFKSLSSFAGPGPQNITPRQRLGLPPVEKIPSYYTGTARQQMKQREEDLRTQAQAEQEDAASAAFAKAFVPTDKNKEIQVDKGNEIDLLSGEEKEISRQAKLYEKLLGGEEARSQSIYDALLAASPAFFKGKDLREAAPQVLESINKSGAFDKPKDIKQAAAQLAIQRRILMDKASAEEKTRLAILSAKNQPQGIIDQITDTAKNLNLPFSQAANLKGPEFFGDAYVGIAPIDTKTKQPILDQMVEGRVYFLNNRYVSIKNGQLVSVNPKI